MKIFTRNQLRELNAFGRSKLGFPGHLFPSFLNAGSRLRICFMSSTDIGRICDLINNLPYKKLKSVFLVNRANKRDGDKNYLAKIYAKIKDLLKIGKDNLNPRKKAMLKLFSVIADCSSSEVLGSKISATTVDGCRKEYLILNKKPIARGGYCSVYEGYDPEEAKRVAIKVLNPAAGNSDPVAKERLKQEFEIMARLKHPAIVSALAQGRVIRNNREIPFIVVEFVDSPTLREYLAKNSNRLSPSEAIDIAIQIVHAMIAARQKGISHRDLKLDNIFYSNGVVKIGDFGLAKAADPAQKEQDITRTGFVVGTPGHYPPVGARLLKMNNRTKRSNEEKKEMQRINFYYDQYALGVLLYRLLMGTNLIFEGENNDPFQIGEISMNPAINIVSQSSFQRDFLAFIDRRTPPEKRSALQRKYRIKKTLPYYEIEAGRLLKVSLPDKIWDVISRLASFNPENYYRNFNEVKYVLLELQREFGIAPL